MSTDSMKRQRGRLLGVLFLLVILGLLALAYGLFIFTVPKAAQPPAGYQLTREVDLASQPFTEENMLAFTLEDTTGIGIYYALENVKTAYLELTLHEAGGASEPILSSQGLRTDRQGGGQWAGELPAGSYQLLLSASQGHGTVAVYWNQP